MCPAALDKQPVYCMVLLLSPENQPQQHLQAMNIVFTNLQKDTFRKFLRQSDTREAIAELLDFSAAASATQKSTTSSQQHTYTVTRKYQKKMLV